MDKKTIYESDYITVEYWADNALIYHVIHQPISTHLDVFKAALNAGTEAMQQYKVVKWLSDDRNNDQLTPEGNEWAFTDWHPRTMQAGWKFWANVVPQDLVAAGTLVPVINNLHQLGLRMQVFSTVEQAVTWLDNLAVEA